MLGVQLFSDQLELIKKGLGFLPAMWHEPPCYGKQAFKQFKYRGVRLVSVNFMYVIKWKC